MQLTSYNIVANSQFLVLELRNEFVWCEEMMISGRAEGT